MVVLRKMRWVRLQGVAEVALGAALGLGCVVSAGADWKTPVAKSSSGSAAAKSGSATKTVKGAARREMSPWELAEHGREVLEAIPVESRTKADYSAAMDGFRAVYHDSPRDVHAAAAVYSVAELLTEQGRQLKDLKTLKAAVGQYEFLRTQYPGSSLRVAALLAQGQIYANDLDDVAAAKERYSLLVKQFPGSGKAEEARAGLEALQTSPGQGAGSKVLSEKRTAVAVPPIAGSAKSVGAKDKVAGGSAGSSSLGAMPVTGGAAASAPTAATNTAKNDERRGSSAPVDAELDGMTAAAPGSSASSIPMGASVPGGSSAPVPGPSNVGRAIARRPGKMAQVTGIRHWSTPTYTRVAIDLGDDVTFEAARVPNPDRIYFDLHGTKLARELAGKSFSVTDDGFLKKIRAAQFSDDMTRVVLDVNDVTEYSAFLLPNPYRLIIDIHGGQVGGTKGPSVPAESIGTAAALPMIVPPPVAATVVRPTVARPVPNTVSTRNASTTEIAALSAQPGKVEAGSIPGTGPKELGVAGGVSGVVGTGSGTAISSKNLKGKKGKTVREDSAPARAAVPTADGQTSLVRALGLKIGRIVIDAGHGGHDSGTIGVDGIEEKDVVLDVALRVGKLLHDRLGAEVVYTRSDDTFIPLETRTAIANKAQADLFLSIHANSSSDSTARGVETYYLNFTSAPDALETAARENAVSDQSIHQLSDLVKKIALKDKISESREFASDVEASLYGGLQRGNAGLKDRGVKKAPFVVLIGANMPSILAEISFVTNPRDASQLQQPDYRQRVAESLYKGVAKYSSGLSGARTNTERASVK